MARLFGVLNVNKPTGISSRQVVDRILKLAGPVKAGHAGTLDPLATGVLVVCVGPATRLVEQIQQSPKKYRATFLLGRRSDTDDVTGRLIEVKHALPVDVRKIEAVLPRFVGRIQQVPPQFSAVHVQGRRAYKLARLGRKVEIEPRTVEVYGIRLIEFRDPDLTVTIECGTGTYIRAIGRDLGDQLGCGAVMSKLVRTRVGPYRLGDSVDLDNLTADSLADVLLPPTTDLAHLPQFVCSPADLEDVRHGRRLHLPEGQAFPEGATVVLLTPNKELAALAHYHSEDRTLAPKQVFVQQEEARAAEEPVP